MTPTLAVIQLPGSFDFAAVKQLVLDSVSSENSKRVYGQALDQLELVPDAAGGRNLQGHGERVQGRPGSQRAGTVLD
jgi:hypothetical protein